MTSNSPKNHHIDPWVLIQDQRRAICRLPLLTPPTINVLQNSAQRLPSDFRRIDQPSPFSDSEHKAVLAKIWRTNHSLSTSQEAAIQSLKHAALDNVDKVHKQVDSLTLEIASLQLKTNQLAIRMCNLEDELAILQKQRTAQMSKADECDAAASAIRLLPPEILGIIFNYVRPATKIEKNMFPHALCQVCSVWRQAAFAFPTLWNTDIFRFSRTGQGNLSFTLRDPRYPWNPGKRVLRAIFPFRNNISSLDLDGMKLDNFFSLSAMAFPALESLQLSGNFLSAGANLRTQVFVGAVKLRKLTLDTRPFSKSLLEDFPWSQITHLDIRRPVLADFIPGIFVRAVDLEYASITIISTEFLGGQSPLSDLSDTTTFAKLTDFKLSSEIFGTKRLSALLSHTCFPVLERFTLLSKFWDGHTENVRILPALLPSLHTIHSLVLTPMFLDIDDITRILDDCSCLSRLTYIFSDEKDSLSSTRLNEVAGLILNASDTFHSLQSLASFTVIAMCFSDNDLQTMVELLSRLVLSWAYDARKSALESVRLYIHIPYSKRTTLTENTVHSVLEIAHTTLMGSLRSRSEHNRFKVTMELGHKWEREDDPNWEELMLMS